jgi:hypothetical protein
MREEITTNELHSMIGRLEEAATQLGIELGAHGNSPRAVACRNALYEARKPLLHLLLPSYRDPAITPANIYNVTRIVFDKPT